MPSIRYGDRVSPEVKIIYDRGLKFLAKTQQADGSWAGGQVGGGVTGLCMMAFLASGEDPNFGQNSVNIRPLSPISSGARTVEPGLSPTACIITASPCFHSPSDGTVDESLLENNGGRRQRSIGEALELAVRAAVTSQKNNQMGGGDFTDVNRFRHFGFGCRTGGTTGRPRNAGIEVPDAVIDRALQYFRTSTSDTGMVAYSGGIGGFGESMNRSSIGTLVFAIGKRKNWSQFKATTEHIVTRLDHQESGHPFYFRYEDVQALFQADFDAWTKWKRENTLMLRDMQGDDGSFNSGYGSAYGTAMSLLSLAVEYRFLPTDEAKSKSAARPRVAALAKDMIYDENREAS